jgi:hypothetical protein
MFHCKTRGGFSLIKHVESKFSPRNTKLILDIISWHVFSRLNRYFLSKLCYFLIQSYEEVIRMIILLYLEQVIQKIHLTECALHKIIESKIKIFSSACCLWYYGESSLKYVHKQSTFWLLLNNITKLSTDRLSRVSTWFILVQWISRFEKNTLLYFDVIWSTF